MNDALARAARLAALEVDDEDAASLTRDLERILAWVGQIASADVDESVAATPDSMPLRDDEPRPSLDLEEVSSRAPQFENGMFVVPRVVGES